MGFRTDKGQMQVLLLALLILLLAVQLLLGYDAQGGSWGILLAGLLVLGIFCLQLWRYRRVCVERARLKQQLEKSEERAENLQRDLDRLNAAKGNAAATDDSRGVVQNLAVRVTGDAPDALRASFFQVLAERWELVQGLLFGEEKERGVFTVQASYAYFAEGGAPEPFREGETLTGQVVKENQPLYLSDIPAGYRIIASGLGRAHPSYIFMVPYPGAAGRCVVELAFFKPLELADREAIVSLLGVLSEKERGLTNTGRAE
jgi:multi-sensor hybrid histidine kinase